MTISKNKPGIIIIASWFVINGLYVSYQLVSAWLRNSSFQNDLIYSLIPLILLVSGIGLFLKKGWGRNFALLSSSYSGFLGLLKIILYFLTKSDIATLVKGSVDIVIAGCILCYLLRKPVREIFSESPVSSSLIGLFLMLYGTFQNSGNNLIDIFWRIMFVIGGVITFKASKHLRESMGSITSE